MVGGRKGKKNWKQNLDLKICGCVNEFTRFTSWLWKHVCRFTANFAATLPNWPL